MVRPNSFKVSLSARRLIDEHSRPRVVVAIPCLNEESTIAKVVRDFRAALPDGIIVVVDNASTDGTAEEARSAGAEVYREKRPGKGYVLQSIFAEIDADIYLLVDGDDTYPAEEVHRLLEPLIHDEADVVVGDRLAGATGHTLRPLHQRGNRLIVWLVNFCFGTSLKDILSGYRAMASRVVESVPVISHGFEIETELTIQALERGFVIKEVPISYRARPSGSVSKLRTFRDGYRILLTIAILLRDRRPLFFFSGISGAICLVGLVLGGMAVIGGEPGRATGISAQIMVSIALVVLAAVVAIGGLVLNAINTRVRELDSLITRLARRK